MIVAMSENRVIARGGKLPWHLPDDLKFFKQTTSGHHVVMGRKTADTLNRPLPNRTNIIVTRDASYTRDGFETSNDVNSAIDRALEAGDDEPFVVGGGEIYSIALPRVNRLYITRVHTTVDDGDTFFPKFDRHGWKLIESTRHEEDERHAFAFTFETWKRT